MGVERFRGTPYVKYTLKFKDLAWEKKNVKHFNHFFIDYMLKFYFGYIELKNILKLCFLKFFLMIIGKFKMTYVAHILAHMVFLLFSADLEQCPHDPQHPAFLSS